jgi:hypothetical protein
MGFCAVLRFCLGERIISDWLERAPVVDPIGAFEGGAFDGSDAAPGGAAMDQLRLEQAGFPG